VGREHAGQRRQGGFAGVQGNPIYKRQWRGYKRAKPRREGTRFT
jgi:hypothetical protein